MAKVRELFTVWGFEVDMKPLERLDQAIETTKGALKSIAVTAAAAGGTVFGLVKFTADAGDEAFKMAQKVGIGVEALQELTYAAKLSDVGAEELQQSLTILSRKAVDAADGSKEALKPFQQLGIGLKDARGQIKSTDVLLTEFAERISRMPDGTRKTAIAVDAFGRSGANLIPLLNQGAAGIAELRKEAQDLGIVFSGEQAKAAEEFNDNLTRLMASIAGVRNLVGNELIPVFSDAVVELKNLIVANRGLIAVNVKGAAETLLILFRGMLFLLSQTVRIVGNLAQVFGGAEKAARLLSFAIAAFLGLKLAFGVGQMVLALGQLAVGYTTAGNAALIAQAKMLLIPLALAAIVAGIALVAEDFLVFSQGGNSVIGLVIKGITSIFDSIAEKSAVAAGILQAVFTVITAPIRAVVNLLGLVRDGVETIFGNKSMLDFLKSAGGRIVNTIVGSTGTSDFAKDFGLQAPPPLPVGSVPVPSGTTLAGRQVNVTQSAQVQVDVSGLPPDIAEKVARTSMTDAFESILRQTGREAETAIER